MNVKYTGLSSVRSISKDEFKLAGVDHEAVQWDASNNFMTDVNDKVAKWLIEIDQEFEEVPKAQS